MPLRVGASIPLLTSLNAGPLTPPPPVPEPTTLALVLPGLLFIAARCRTRRATSARAVA